MFTGIKLDYHRDLRVTFGAYAQIEVPHAESNDPRAARTEGAISLLPSGDLQGGCYFYILGSGAIVKRDKF
eukprot:gene15101-16841_t